jgi:hypothetical protein
MTIQSLRNRDKMKDDAIAQLSDQLMALTARCRNLSANSNKDGLVRLHVCFS